MNSSPLDTGITNNNSAEFKDFRPNSDRARNAQTLVWLVMAGSIVLIATTYLELDVLERLKNGVGEYDEGIVAEAERSDSINQIATIIYFILRIISAVFFIQWFRRAYHNISNFSTPQLSDGWAAGAWFVPIFNWFRPYQMMREMWQATTNQVGTDEFNETGYNYKLNIGIWWTLWVIFAVLTNVILRIDQKSIDEITTADNLSLIAHALNIPLAIITVKIIKEYNKLEETLA
jgi:hypothetical protein